MWSGERARFECVSEGGRRSALRAGRILTLHPWEGRCRALAALWVYFLIWKDLKQSAALSGAAGLPE